MSPAPHSSSTTDWPGLQRIVSSRGGTQVIGQRVQVGLRYTSRIVTIEIDETTLRTHDDHDQLA